MAGRRLAGPQAAARATVKSQQHLGVVVKPAAVDDAAQLGAQRAHALGAHMLGQLEGMAADVADAGPRTGLRRVGAPAGLLLALLLDGLGQPVLQVFHLHQAQLAQRPALDPLARLAHHRVAGVVVGQRQQQAGLGGQRLQLAGVGTAGGQRFVADHRDAGLQEGGGHRHRQVVGGTMAITSTPSARDLGPCHGRIVTVDAIRRQAQRQP